MTCEELINVDSSKSPIPGIVRPFLWLTNGGITNYLLLECPGWKLGSKVIRSVGV